MIADSCFPKDLANESIRSNANACYMHRVKADSNFFLHCDRKSIQAHAVIRMNRKCFYS